METSRSRGDEAHSGDFRDSYVVSYSLSLHTRAAAFH